MESVIAQVNIFRTEDELTENQGLVMILNTNYFPPRIFFIPQIKLIHPIQSVVLMRNK